MAEHPEATAVHQVSARSAVVDLLAVKAGSEAGASVAGSVAAMRAA